MRYANILGINSDTFVSSIIIFYLLDFISVFMAETSVGVSSNFLTKSNKIFLILHH